MRIAIVCDEGLPPYSLGGIQKYVLLISEMLTARGHRVEVFTPMEEAGDYPFLVHPVKPCGSFWDGYLSAALAYPVIYRRLLRALRDGVDSQFDVIYAYNPFMAGRAGGKVAREKNIPSLLYYTYSHTADHFLRGRRLCLAELLARFGIKGYEKIVVNSQILRRAVSARFGIEPSRIEVLPLAVDCRTFHPGMECKWVRDKFLIPQDIPLLLFVGRLERLKGILILLEAAARVFPKEEARLLVVGNGSLAGEARRLAKEKGIEDKVIFAGAVPEQELPAFYCSSDLIIYPGLDECYSLVVLEAASCGKAILGTDHPIMLEEFSEGGRAAAIHRRGDVDSMAEAIMDLLRHPERRQEMGAYAREKVLARHALGRYIDGLISLWEDMRHE